MNKTLKQMLEVYGPKPGDEEKFKNKHVVVKSKTLDKSPSVKGKGPSEDDDLFQAANIKTAARPPHHGYSDRGIDDDEKVYEQRVYQVKSGDKLVHMTGSVKNAFAKAKSLPSGTVSLHGETLKEPAGVKEGIEDRIEAARQRAAAKGRTLNEPEKKKSALRKIAGKSYGGSKQKDEYDNLDEGARSSVAQDLYKQHHGRIKGLIKGISAGIDNHKAALGGKPHFGHVGSLNHFANQLQDLHDNIHQQGEYATREHSPSEPVKEGFDNHSDIAKFLVDRHKGEKVTKKHVREFEDDLIGSQDSRAPLDHDEIMHHVNKLQKEEVERVDEVSVNMLTNYAQKATKQIKDLTPHAKKGEYKGIAKRLIDRRNKGLGNVYLKVQGRHANVPATWDEETQLAEVALKVALHVKPHTEKGHHVVVKSSDPKRFKQGEKISATELEQGQDDGYLKVTHVGFQNPTLRNKYGR